MGVCIQSHDKPSQVPQKTLTNLLPEEKIIMQCEAKHVFSKKHFKDISKSIKSETSNEFLSSPQLRRALLDLEISLDDLTSPDSATFHLLSKSKNQKNLYEVRKLTLICIYLGLGNALDKCDWMFRQYDTDASLEIDLPEFQNMIGEIFDVCGRILPVLSLGEGVCSLTPEQYQSYSNMLMSGADKSMSEMAEVFKLEGEVNYDKFMNLMTKNEVLSQLLNSTLVRELLRKNSQS